MHAYENYFYIQNKYQVVRVNDMHKAMLNYTLQFLMKIAN